MNTEHSKFKLDRRGFLSRSAVASFGIGPIANAISQFTLMERAAATNISIGDDYKALICVFLRGGCDKNYFLVPRAAHGQSGQYTTSRGIAGIKNGVASTVNDNAAGDDVTAALTPANAGAGEFGLNPACSDMANMFNSGELAIIQNIGTLAEPTTKTTYQNGTAIRPVQLFSHSNQVQEWMATTAEKPFTSGWAGSVASLLNDTENPNGLASMLITAAGNNNWLVSPGGGPPQYSVTSSGALTLSGYGTSYASAIQNGEYRTTDQGHRLQGFERILNRQNDHILGEGYNEIMRRARAGEGLIGDALVEAGTLQGTGVGQVDFNGLFPNSNLSNELKLIAQLIAGRRCLGNRRQIFFCDLGGFDNHSNINGNLPNLLGQVNGAVHGFNEAMKQLADADADFNYEDFTCFEMSDFNRTFTPNGTNLGSNGTDHAWGTHAWAFGGAVKAKHAGSSKLYGTYPTLNPNGPDSVNGRGRYIPTTSIDQYGSTLAEWFGVANGDLSTIFPNLPRFDYPGTNLDFIDTTS